jgi:DNA-directed RNA polymerase specialized sigma24 family protein
MGLRADGIFDIEVSNKYGKPKLRREVIEGAVAAYLRGVPLKEIAARFDCSMQSVINHAAKAGFKLRKKRRRP